MKNKTEKKLVSFFKSVLINGFLRDKAYVENNSESSIIEQSLLKDILPEHSQASYIVENHLYSETGSVNNTLEALFSYNSAGVNWKAKYDNFLPLVECAKSLSLYSETILTGSEWRYHHCCDQLESIITKLRRIQESETDVEKKYMLSNEIKYAEDLLKELKNEPEFSKMLNFYNIVISNWEYLKDLSITYRFLSDLAFLDKNMRNSSEDRIRLLTLIQNISAEWDID